MAEHEQRKKLQKRLINGKHDKKKFRSHRYREKYLEIVMGLARIILGMGSLHC